MSSEDMESHPYALKWKPHFLQLLDGGERKHSDRHIFSRFSLPYFQEWLDLRRNIESNCSKTRGGNSSNSRNSKIGRPESLSPSNRKYRLTESPKCNFGKLYVGGNFPGKDSSFCSPTLVDEQFDRSSQDVEYEHTPCTSACSRSFFPDQSTPNQHCTHCEKYSEISNIQREVDCFRVQSARRIRDLIASPNRNALCAKLSIENSRGEDLYRLSQRTSSKCVAKSNHRKSLSDDVTFVATPYCADNCTPDPTNSARSKAETYSSPHCKHICTQTAQSGTVRSDSENFLVSYKSGAQYAGEISSSEPHGTGWFAGGTCTYRGQWVRGQPHGRGDYSWPDGDRYCGEFKHGLRDGHGIYYAWSGEKYAGTWREDELSGVGMCTRGDGRRLVLSAGAIESEWGLTPHPSYFRGAGLDADPVISIAPLPGSMDYSSMTTAAELLT